jgi:hypothetical protein
MVGDEAGGLARTTCTGVCGPDGGTETDRTYMV